MIVAGLILLVAGFLAIMPSDSTPGSMANRQVRQYGIQVVGTPGHADSSRRSVRVRTIVGTVLLLAGIILLVLA